MQSIFFPPSWLQVKLVNIRNDDITDGNPKLTLGLIWTIILHFQVSALVAAFSSGEVTHLQLICFNLFLFFIAVYSFFLPRWEPASEFGFFSSWEIWGAVTICQNCPDLDFKCSSIYWWFYFWPQGVKIVQHKQGLTSSHHVSLGSFWDWMQFNEAQAWLCIWAVFWKGNVVPACCSFRACGLRAQN